MKDQHRFEAEAILDPDACELLLDGASGQLVTVRLFDGPDLVSSATGEPADPKPGVSADLRPDEARRLAARLLWFAEHADRATRQSVSQSLGRSAERAARQSAGVAAGGRR